MNWTSHASSSRGNLAELSEGGTRLLVEAGLPLARIREATGWQLAAFRAALVTHEHKDHAAGVAHLLRVGIPVACSRGTAKALGIRSADPLWYPLVPQVWTRIGSMRVLPLPALHNSAEPLAFVVDAGDERTLVLEDSAPVAWRVEGATRICIEANWCEELLHDLPEAALADLRSRHMSLAGCLEVLGRQDLSRCREIRLLHLSAGRSDAGLFRARVEAAFGVPVWVEDA